MDGFERELEQIIVMGDARLNLESLCKIYRESVLDDKSLSDVPLEAKQFAMAESLTRGFLAVVRKMEFPEERVISGLMTNFMLPLVAALHDIVIGEPDRRNHENNRG